MAGKANIPPPASGELYYRIPESDHEDLGHIRDELGMLAHFVLRDCCDREEFLHISPKALAHCFARLAVEIGAIMDNCLSPSDHAARVNRSRH